jgi:hypothetical protein
MLSRCTTSPGGVMNKHERQETQGLRVVGCPVPDWDLSLCVVGIGEHPLLVSFRLGSS